MKNRRHLWIFSFSVLVAGALAGCTPSPPPPVVEGNVVPSSLPAYYRDRPDIKALARSVGGQYWIGWGFCSVRDATVYAKTTCEKRFGGSCKLEYIGPNRVDGLDDAERNAVAQKYQSQARRHSAALRPQPLASVSYAALTEEKSGAEHVTTGRVYFDPRNICRGTIEGDLGEHHCSGEWVSEGREDPAVLFPMNGTVSLTCGDELSYSGRAVFIKNGAGKLTADGSDGSTMRAVYSRRADLSNLSKQNFELIWQTVK